MLAVTVDGGKLAPMLAFKRKTMPRDVFPAGLHVRVNEKGWMDETLMLDWFDAVCHRR